MLARSGAFNEFASSQAMSDEERKDLEKDELINVAANATQIMDKLCKIIYAKDSSDRIRTR